MIIQEMTKAACLAFLARKRFGRLACAGNSQPYIVPINFAHSGNHLYAFTTLGRKITYMRSNPLVCVETDEVESPQNWSSVIATGQYEELPDTPDFAHAREFGYTLLDQQPLWWEPGYVETLIEGKERPLDIIYFRIQITDISGHYTVV
jgi:nitroimidazol reductase NimA-like FMN-containing flavoprotein (pyridoxamine 5'-phosphate oxidase superfamily)